MSGTGVCRKAGEANKLMEVHKRIIAKKLVSILSIIIESGLLPR